MTICIQSEMKENVVNLKGNSSDFKIFYNAKTRQIRFVNPVKSVVEYVYEMQETGYDFFQKDAPENYASGEALQAYHFQSLQ